MVKAMAKGTMDATIISAISVTCFIFGFSLSAYMSYLSKKIENKTSEEFEVGIRKKAAMELSMHAYFQLGEVVDKELLQEMSSELIGFNLGLHTAGLIINSEPGSRLLIVEKVSDDGEIVYDVEKT